MLNGCVVCVLYILFYGAQLRAGDQAVAPSAPVSTAPTRPAVQEPCTGVQRYPADIETGAVFSRLDLNPSWMQRREYWSSEYEDRYTRRRAMWSKLPLRYTRRREMWSKLPPQVPRRRAMWSKLPLRYTRRKEMWSKLPSQVY